MSDVSQRGTPEDRYFAARVNAAAHEKLGLPVPPETTAILAEFGPRFAKYDLMDPVEPRGWIQRLKSRLGKSL